MVIYLFCIAAAIGLGGLSGWSDLKGMTIPNEYVAGVLVAFFVAFGVAHFAGADVFAGFVPHFMTGCAVLIVTFAMYAMRQMGGGDSKLIAAYSFWFGLQGLAVILLAMTVAGVLLSLFALFVKKTRPFKVTADGSWMQRTQDGEGVVAYGIPIAIGAAVAFYDMDLLAPDTLKLFLMPN